MTNRSLSGQRIRPEEWLLIACILFTFLWRFVAIPLPGTGAWTGSLAAAFLDMRLRRALPAIPGPVTCRRGAQRPKASHRGGFQRRPQSLPPAGGKVSRRMP